MNESWRYLSAVIGGSMVLFASCSALRQPVGSHLNKIQKEAGRRNLVIAVPNFETTGEGMSASVESMIQDGEVELKRIREQDPVRLSFESTIRAIDDLNYRVQLMSNRIGWIKETHPLKAMREVAETMIARIEQWKIKVQYDEGVYKVVSGYQREKPKLVMEEKRLYEETLRDYRRAGFRLKSVERKKVEELRKELVVDEIRFGTNIRESISLLTFTKSELPGLSDAFLRSVRTGNDVYTLDANSRNHAVTILGQCQREETRKSLFVARSNVAREKNAVLMRKLLSLRAEIARRLGYKHWADYQIETKMMKSADRAKGFLKDLLIRLGPKFRAEMKKIQEMKARDTGDPQVKIYGWDLAYYDEQIYRNKYGVDTEALRVYFPMDNVLNGMFRIFETVFQLKISPVEPPYRWVPDVMFFAISDSKTDEPLGLLYIDPFPRDGKYRGFAEFELIGGKLLSDGRYQRPVMALVCNFRPPEGGRPSLMDYSEVGALFHEFGHALHGLLTRAKYAKFSGTNVPQDFVEVPSYTLVHWLWDRDVLKRLASDYRESSKTIPDETLDKVNGARIATSGKVYRRMAAMALVDLDLHMRSHVDSSFDVVARSNKVFGEAFLPMPLDTAFVAGFGHLALGYDAGYYGYAWSEVIAANLTTAFEKAPGKVMDSGIGLRLREEIYAMGGSRDPDESVRAFLGHPISIRAFLREIGIEK